MEAAGAAGDGDTTPVLDRLLICHVPTGYKAVVWWTTVHVKCRFCPHDELDNGGIGYTDWTCLAADSVSHIAPLMPALNMATVQIYIRLVFWVGVLNRVFPWDY